MLPYLAAVGIITTSGVTFVVGAGVLVGYVLIMLLPAVLLLVACLAAGSRLDDPLARIRDWMQRRTGGALGWIIGIVGVLLAIDAGSVLSDRGVLEGWF